jgi:predicted RNA-binding Zn-ribbon protein involved in translation (DUF1610 family)
LGGTILSCASKPGVKWALDAIEDVLGVRVAQGTWHQLRNAAFSSPGSVQSRARADANEIIAIADLIAKENDGRYEDGSAIDKTELRAEALSSLGQTTRSTCHVFTFMSRFDMKDLIDAANTVSNHAQKKCESCSSHRCKAEWDIKEDVLTASCEECSSEIARCSKKSISKSVSAQEYVVRISNKNTFIRDENGSFSCHSCGNADGSFFYPSRGDGFPTHGLDPLWDRKTYICGKCHSVNQLSAD